MKIPCKVSCIVQCFAHFSTKSYQYIIIMCSLYLTQERKLIILIIKVT